MTHQPGVWGRLRALIEGEVPASTLEAYRRAGGPAYDLQREAEERRHTLQGQGVNPWTVDVPTQAWMLCAWNAFVLQTLADQFLEADYRVEPATIGFVPPVTAEQALAFYTQVPAWLSRAQQARTDPAYRIDVTLPADLPPWSEVEPCPRAHRGDARRHPPAHAARRDGRCVVRRGSHVSRAAGRGPAGGRPAG